MSISRTPRCRETDRRSVSDERGVIDAMTVDLERAKAGDERAFATLVEPFRRELQLHCYRMLGSVQDAEDVVQDTLLAAWRGLDGFEERARCAPGSTGSQPTGVSTRFANAGAAQPRRTP
jgi:sigma-70-like protein